MAPPKKNKGTKMGLQDFLLNDEFGSSTGNWADDVEETLNVTSDSQLRGLASRSGHNDGPFGRPGFTDRGDYRSDFRGDRFGREPRVMPNDPPFKAHVSGLPFEVPEEELPDAIREAFAEYTIEDMSPVTAKGDSRFIFITFGSRNDLVAVAGDSPIPIHVAGRKVFVSVADRRDPGRRQQDGRELDWTRRGPLPPDPSRGQFNDRPDRPARDFGAARRAAPPSELDSEAGDRYQERRAPREQAPPRTIDWTNRPGPLSPKPSDERPTSRSGSQSRTGGGVPMDSRSDSYRGRGSPAWAEGKEGGSRPPRREMPERVPSAAEKESSWRSHMRADVPTSAAHSRDGSEAPSSPAAPASATLAGRGGRPVLNLAKRTVSDANAAVVSPGPLSADPKANPFGAARPIDTAAREREIAEKRVAAAKAKREAEQKAKDEKIAKEKEKRLAKEKEAAEAEATAAEANEVSEAAESAEAAAAAQATEVNGEKSTLETNPTVVEEKEPKETNATTIATDAPGSPKEVREGAPAHPERRLSGRPREVREREPSFQKGGRAVESDNWRTAIGERGGRGGPNGPRGRGGRSRFNDRPPRPNGGGAPSVGEQSKPAQTEPQQTSAPPTPKLEENDGWTTVPNKNRRSTRPIA